MRPVRLIVAVSAAAVVAASVLPASAYPRPGSTGLVSAATGSNVPGNKNSSRAVITPNGRYVAFQSAATNLVPGDTNGASDVFERDRRTGRTKRVSVASGGGQAILPTGPLCDEAAWGGAGSPAISSDGRYVAFVSCFSNLTPSSPAATVAAAAAGGEVYVHDTKTDTTTLVSVDSKGNPANGDVGPAEMSANGRWVVFASDADNLSGSCESSAVSQLLCQAQVNLGGQWQVYRHDIRTGRTDVVSVNVSGDLGNGDSFSPFISPDGRYVGFTSRADSLTSNDVLNPACLPNSPSPETPKCSDVFLRDLKTGKTQLVSVGVDGKPGNGPSGEFGLGAAGSLFDPVPESVSIGDRYVTFEATATDLVPNGGSTAIGTFVRDLRTGRTEGLNVDSDGENPGTVTNGTEAPFPAISADGRLVAFVPNCAFGGTGVWVHDTVTGATEYATPTLSSGPSGSCTVGYQGAYGQPVLSADGRLLAFGGPTDQFLRGQSTTTQQIFVRDRGDTLGVGELVRSGKLTVAGSTGFVSTGLVSAADPANDVDAALTAGGAKLIQASVAYRRQYADLFARLDVAQMPIFPLAGPAIVYGLSLTVGSARYQVRVAKTGVDASFGLFRLYQGSWTQVATLRGGYGTTGQEVVVALPLRDLGLQSGGTLSGVRAFTALGSYLTGAGHVLDTIALSR